MAKKKPKNWQKRSFWIAVDDNTADIWTYINEPRLFTYCDEFTGEQMTYFGGKNVFAICNPHYLEDLNIPLNPGEICKVTVEKIKAKRAKCKS